MASKQGKSITTSVPSISIKFHANAEQLEELYVSDDEQKSEINEKKLSAASKEKGSHSTGNIQETTEGSPLKYLRSNKRSNSTEVTSITDSSPPSDPWKFFSEIKGKIAKSVEEKITEIKTRNQEEGSPSKGKSDKITKENSSLSDSEELSESSLSKTCGIVSTTEGAEMSSDDDTPSLKNETPTNLKIPQSPTPITPTLRQRFRLLKAAKNSSTASKEGTVSTTTLAKICNMNADSNDQMLPEQNEEVESAVDALEDVDFRDNSSRASSKMARSESTVLRSLARTVDNIEIDNDGTVNIKEVSGFRWRGGGDEDANRSEVKTVFAPKGFVDFRYRMHREKNNFLENYVEDVKYFIKHERKIENESKSRKTIAKHDKTFVGFKLLDIFVDIVKNTPTKNAFHGFFKCAVLFIFDNKKPKYVNHSVKGIETHEDKKSEAKSRIEPVAPISEGKDISNDLILSLVKNSPGSCRESVGNKRPCCVTKTTHVNDRLSNKRGNENEIKKRIYSNSSLELVSKIVEFRFPILVLTISITYLIIQRYSVYIAGMIAGIFITSLSYYLMNKIAPPSYPHRLTKDRSRYSLKDIWEVPAIKEHQPILKYEGWLNEFPDQYDPIVYHISLTQPVYLRLQGNLLRISNTSSKVPKRAMWNETEIKKNFNHHRIYNLLGAKVTLLPLGLAKIRHWSKKYPICITLCNDQYKFENDITSKETDDEKESSPSFLKKGTGFSFRKKMSTVSSPQRFSTLCAEQDNFYTDVDLSRSDTSSPAQEEEKIILDTLEKNMEPEEENDNHSNLEDSWSNCTLDESPTETRIYLFGRTDREKEDWFRRLCMATHPQGTSVSHEIGGNLKKAVSTESILNDNEYTVYMSSIMKAFKKREEEIGAKFPNEIMDISTVSWINAFLGRILFDCMCDEVFTSRVKERIHRKLAAIKLPYFIEELSITELNLGKTPPLFRKIGRPTIDDRGLWIDMAMTYEGLVVLTLMTKLNLMKLKQPPTDKEVQNKSAIFHSDIDDSAESSSEDESLIFPNVPETVGTTSGAAPPVNKSKKLMKMVDRIAESKFFQAATDNKYIKRAMEGVSKTDLRLKVEVRALEGTLVINIPPPPTDRIWVGFRPIPELSLSAHPIVGERNITFMHVTSWIEKKLIQEFQKILVKPNMEDLIIPIMMSKLPE